VKPRGPRFYATPHQLASEVYIVRDSDHYQYNLPERAVNLHLRQDAARKIADILNEEWGHFLRHPS